MHSKRSELLKSAEILLISCGGYSRADYSVAAWSPSSALIWIGTNRILKSYHVIVRYRDSPRSSDIIFSSLMSTCFASKYQASSGRLPSSPTSGFEIPVVDFTRDSPSTAQQIVSHAATTDGLVFVRNLPHQPDFLAIRRLFDSLYQSPQLAARLNSTYEKRGVFKLAGKLTNDPTVDDKSTIDLSAQRLQYIQDSQLLQDLGAEFETTVKFFETVQKQLVPLVLNATASVIGKNVDLDSVHQERNNNFRLIDYHSSASPVRRGCGEHGDYGTATIIFQDGSGGLEFQDPQTDEWHAVPGHETVIV